MKTVWFQRTVSEGVREKERKGEKMMRDWGKFFKKENEREKKNKANKKKSKTKKKK